LLDEGEAVLQSRFRSGPIFRHPQRFGKIEHHI
jgi:hypothetical protein